ITNFAAGQIDVFQVDQTTGALTVAPSSPVHASSPIHLAVEPSGSFVYVPDSQNALINIFSIDSAGNMTLKTPFAIPTGPVPGPARPQLYVQIGNTINVYSIDATSGALTPPTVQAQFFTASNLVIANVQ